MTKAIENKAQKTTDTHVYTPSPNTIDDYIDIHLHPLRNQKNKHVQPNKLGQYPM